MRYATVAVSVAVLALLSYFQFPGHTFLQSDTQIYVPILERFWDPSVLEKDLVASRPHVAFTIYDEVSIFLRRLTGLDFEGVLTFQQLVYRALGILGVYLIARAAALAPGPALFVAAVFTLGATIAGPAVLTVEYEPVPRGFAVPLLLIAVGLCAHGKGRAAAVAGAVATMYHPPTVYPFAIVLLVSAARRHEWRTALIFISGALLLLIFSLFQRGMVEAQLFFAQVPPDLEELQRMRASYNWVGVWFGRLFWHYFVLLVAGFVAYWRVRTHLRPEVKPFLLGLPIIGAASVPMSYLLLDRVKWALIPQVQPARALLFVTATGVILAAIAGVHAALARRRVESVLWFVLVFAVPSQTLYLQVLWPDLSNPVLRTRFFVVLALALFATTALRIHPKAIFLAAVIPFFALPHLGSSQNYPLLHTPELDALSSWARSSTSKDAVFLFADAGRDLAPGVFRARARRALYVDWKAGGQVNFLKSFAEDWWFRWKQVSAGNFEQPEIDYLVFKAENRLPGRTPVYENSAYLVYTH